MTTTDLAPARPAGPAGASAARSHAAAPRLSFARIVRSEWIKQWSLPSTRWTLLGLLVALAGFGMLAAATASGGASTQRPGPPVSASDPLGIVLSGANFGLLLVAVLGTLVGAREYGSGLVRTTFAAVPNRLAVLAAKLVAFLGSLLPVLVVGIGAAFVGGMAVLHADGSATLGLGDAGVLRVLVGEVAYLAALGVIGVAVGTAMRAVAGGLGVVIGGVLFVPALAGALLPSSWSEALKYLPSNAGESVTALTTPGGMLAAAPAAAVLAGWVVAAVALAAVLLRRRDV